MLRQFEHPAHDLLAAFRRDFVERLAPSHRDQHEEAPAHHRKLFAQEFVDRGQVIDGFFGNQCVDLDGYAEPSAMARGLHSVLERSRHGADRVMLFRAGPVEAQPQALDSMFFQLRDCVIGQFRRGARRDRDFQAQAVRVVDQFVDILAAERIASRQNEVRQRIAESDQLLQEALALLGRELQRIGIGHGFGAAVLASQAASLSHLPVNQQRIFRKVMGQTAHMRSNARTNHDFPLTTSSFETHRQIQGSFGPRKRL